MVDAYAETEAPPSAPRPRPNRAIAIVLALLLPAGVGHYYAGLPRRAALWFGIPCLVLIAAAAALTGARPLVWIGLGTIVVVIVAGGLGPVVDLALLDLRRTTRPPWWQVALAAVLLVAVTGVVRFGVRRWLSEAFKIPSSSMAPTLRLQDHILVDKTAAVELGDAIVFRYPDPDPGAPAQDFVERVIAQGGDTIEFEDGHPILNGWRVPSCRAGRYELQTPDTGASPGELYVEFLGEHAYLAWFQDGFSPGREGPYRVPHDEVWVVGDNRNNSSDSRNWRGGQGMGVPRSAVHGRAHVVWLAFGPENNVTLQRIGLDLNGDPTASDDMPPDVARGIERCLATRPQHTHPPRSASL